MKITFKELKHRFTSRTPDFWREVRKKMLQAAGAFGALGGGLLTIDKLPLWVYTMAENFVKVGLIGPLIIAFVVSFTVDDSNGKS